MYKKNLKNEEIKSDKVYLINRLGKYTGLFLLKEALKIASFHQCDLVLFGYKSDFPLCRLMKYSQYLFKQNKKSKEKQKNNMALITKELKLRYTIQVHDYDVRIKQLKAFLFQGHIVKITILLKGREQNHVYLALNFLNKIIKEVATIINLIKKPYRNSKNIVCLLIKKNICHVI
uniref:InfC n=1 Tax=Pterocladiophila hemisphaerica TaxID=2712948 RepID=A0A6M3WWI6_9FLOR|nr:InfC [Pterocladiophila hemisphaerica]